MAHTIRATSTRDGQYARPKGDKQVIRQQNRARRHQDAAQLRTLPRCARLADGYVWHSTARRDVLALPSF